jgi:hypothetical protein
MEQTRLTQYKPHSRSTLRVKIFKCAIGGSRGYLNSAMRTSRVWPSIYGTHVTWLVKCLQYMHHVTLYKKRGLYAGSRVPAVLSEPAVFFGHN